MAVRRAALRKPLAAAFGTAGLVWLLGTVALYTLSDSQGQLPAASLRGLGGETIAITDFKGKPTVINFWATWCPPCMREMPVLQETQAARPDVNFVFLDQGESAGKVRSFLAAHQLPIRNVLLDERGEVAATRCSRPADLAFYDASGHLIAARVAEHRVHAGRRLAREALGMIRARSAVTV